METETVTTKTNSCLTVCIHSIPHTFESAHECARMCRMDQTKNDGPTRMDYCENSVPNLL